MDQNVFSSREQNNPLVQRVALTNAYLRSVYNWMAAGLLVTALVAYSVASTEVAVRFIFGNMFVFYGMIIGELALVFFLSSSISRLSAGMASALFLLYSALNGATLAAVLLVYTSASIFQAFFTTAGMFVAMSAYGLVTKKDLTSWGSFLTMGLFGVIIALVVNIFLQSSMLDFVISCVGVVVFLGLTAYDTQKLREFGAAAPEGDSVALRRGVILGALTLYLDFINLFIMMLRFMGDRR